MNLSELKNTVMFQTNNDADDLGDFLPYLINYLNEGYDRLVYAYCGQHVSADSDTYTTLRNDKTSPELPEWAHSAIADWATWLVYRNGNVQKQNRGMQFKNSFETIESQLRGMTTEEKGLTDADVTHYGRKFLNIPG